MGGGVRQPLPIFEEKYMPLYRGQVNFKEKRPETSLQFRATKMGHKNLVRIGICSMRSRLRGESKERLDDA